MSNNFITKPTHEVYSIDSELLMRPHVLLRYRRLRGSHIYNEVFDTVSDAAIFAIKHINCYDKYREIHAIEILYNWESVWIDCGYNVINNAILVDLIGKFD